MKAQLFTRIALFTAIVTFGAISVYNGHTAAQPLPAQQHPLTTWQLVLDASDGQRYVMDHDLTLADCFDAVAAKQANGWSCENR